MFTKMLIGAAALAAVAAPAAAATFTVTFPSTIAIPASNDYLTPELTALGLTIYASNGAAITLDGPGRVTFEFLGSESGVSDTFTAGSVTDTQGPDANNFAAPRFLGSATFGAGAFNPVFSSSLVNATVGQEGFGIFLPTGTTGSFTSNVLYFGYDNQPGVFPNDDDNHDDYIVRVTVGAVPEASTWAMMIVGFGLVGFAARRRASIASITA